MVDTIIIAGVLALVISVVLAKNLFFQNSNSKFIIPVLTNFHSK